MGGKGAEHTALGGTEVLARSRRARTGTTSLLNGKGASLELLTLQAVPSSIGLIGGHEVDKAEAARLLGVRVAHDLALLDIAVLGEESGDFILAELGVDAGDEQVGARVDGTLAVPRATTVVLGWGAAKEGALEVCGLFANECGSWGRLCVNRKWLSGLSYRSPPGEAERRRALSWPLSLRGEALRLSRS